jgi:hypothetical protein
MEMCLDYSLFKTNMDVVGMRDTKGYHSLKNSGKLSRPGIRNWRISVWRWLAFPKSEPSRSFLRRPTVGYLKIQVD